MSYKSLIKEAKKSMDNKFGKLLFTSIIANVLGHSFEIFIPFACVGLIYISYNGWFIVKNILIVIIEVVFGMTFVASVLSFISLGINKVFYKAKKNEEFGEKDLFSFFKSNLGSSFYLTIKKICYIVLVPLVIWSLVMIFTEALTDVLYNSNVSEKLLEIAYIVIFVIASICLLATVIRRELETSMAHYIMVREPNLDGDRAYERSKVMMQGNLFPLLLLRVRLIPYAIYNLIFFIGLPTINYCFVSFYTEVYESVLTRNAESGVNRTCPKCGTPAPEDTNYCSRCGSLLDGGAEVKVEKQFATIKKEDNSKEINKLKEQLNNAEKQRNDSNNKIDELVNQKKQSDDKISELMNQRKQDENKIQEMLKQKDKENEEKYKHIKELLEDATTSKEYGFINSLLSSMQDYKDCKELLTKYKKVEEDLKLQEDLLNS